MPIKNHDDFLNAVAEAIDISPSMMDNAIERYENIGDWLGDMRSAIRQHAPETYTQGSFRLGTVIRPIGDGDEFDIDLVCELKDPPDNLSMEMLKSMVGDELKAYATQQAMNNQPEDKRRCWTMEYAEAEKFHLDILPAIPGHEKQQALLEQGGFFDLASNEIISTAIGITDNELPEYRDCTAEWPLSNPKGYAEWFDKRQLPALVRSRHLIVESDRDSIYTSIDDVPRYRVKTPLQRCIQLLKRHRDTMFDNDEHAPISIIITTLSTLAYNDEKNIKDTLEAVLKGMDSDLFIKDCDGTIRIENPINPSENFADKWAEHPERKTKFYEWLEQARRDFGLYINGRFDQPNEGLCKCISKTVLDSIKVKVIAAPVVMSPEQLNAEIAHTKSEGGGSKPWCEK